MAEDNQTVEDQAQTGEQVESAADSSQESYVTSEQLSDFRKGLMGDLRKTMAGMIRTQQQPESPKTARKQETQDASQQSAPDIQDIIRRERLIERSLAKHGLSEQQGDHVRKLMQSDGAENPEDYIEEFAKTWGLSGESNAEPSTQTAPPNPNPASDGGSPGRTASMQSDDVPIWQWSEQKTDSYIQEHGRDAYNKMLKERLPRDLKGKRFQAPRR